jgi:hypothetical protein
LKIISTPWRADPMISNRLANLEVNAGLTALVQQDVYSVAEAIAGFFLVCCHADIFGSMTNALRSTIPYLTTATNGN